MGSCRDKRLITSPWTVYLPTYRHVVTGSIRPNREQDDGYQTCWIPAIRPRTRRMVHWRGPRRSAVYRSRSGPGGRGERNLRTRCADRMAHPSARSDTGCHGRLRLSTALGRADRADPARRRGLVPARREALARCNATTAMTHIAIQEKLDGKAVDWMEQVSDEQYRSR